MHDDTPYQEHVLGAQDVCSNCLKLIRAEAASPIRRDDRTRDSGAWTTDYERIPKRTTVEYPGVGRDVTHAKGTFCGCGVESARERIWSSGDLSRERFKELLQNVLRTLDEKGVTVKRQETAGYALQAFDDDKGPDAALAEAIDAGIVAAVAGQDGQGSDDRLRADGGTIRDS
jgi:hypothetical protein